MAEDYFGGIILSNCYNTNMKLISLNTWGGRAGKEGLLSFFNKYKDDVDIFCLQEIWSAPYKHLEGCSAGGLKIDHQQIMVYGMQEISSVMSDYSRYFRPHNMDNYGLMILLKKDIEVIDEGEVFVHKHKGFIPNGDIGKHARNIQYVNFDFKNKPLTVINFHGLWNGKGKTDSEDRIQQSKNIINFLKNLKGDYILSGDFNLLPNTESIKMFELYGLRNLITEHGVTSTRSSMYTKPDKHADYIFVSKGIKVNKFEVLSDEVSDHLPLLLDFDLE